MGLPGGSVIKNPPAIQETQKTQVWSLAGKAPLEEEVATHSSINAGTTALTELGRLQFMGSQRPGQDWADTQFFQFLSSSELTAHTHGIIHLPKKNDVRVN